MRWEYKVFVLAEAFQSQEMHLNELGKAGWELRCVSDGRAYLGKKVFDECESVNLVERSDTGKMSMGCCGAECSC
jgi:hypothetical protein